MENNNTKQLTQFLFEGDNWEYGDGERKGKTKKEKKEEKERERRRKKKRKRGIDGEGKK